MFPHTTTLLKIFVKPNAKQFRHQWLDKDILKIDIPAPPENNKANQLLIQYLANLLDIPQNKIEIKGGHTSKHKYVLIQMDINSIKEKIK